MNYRKNVKESQRKCIGCDANFYIKESQKAKIFCSNKCLSDSVRLSSKTKKFLQSEKDNLLREYEIIQMQKELLMMKESTGLGYKIRDNHKKLSTL